ncbi:MAG: ABC transporter ATP-binding protein [Clostridia bacterium]
MHKLKLLTSFMKGGKAAYIISMASMAIAMVVSLVNPLIIRLAVDSIIGDQLPESAGLILRIYNHFGREILLANLWICGLFLVSFSILNGFFMYFARKYTAVVSEKIAMSMRMRLYDHIQHLPYSYHIKVQTGDLIQRCTSDLETVRRFIAVQFIDIVRAVTLVTAAMIVMLSLNVSLTLISFTVTPVIIFMSFKFFTFIRDKFQISDEAEGEMTTILQENLTSMRIVRAFTKQDYEIEKFNRSSRNYMDKDFVVSRLMAWYWSASDILCDAQIGIVLILGTFWAANGILTIGTLLAFMSYTSNMIWPIRNLGRVLADMGRASVSLGRIDEVLSTVAENKADDVGLRPDIKGDITFENVSFKYSDDIDVLKNASFHIRAGQTVAILGRTGSGKSTLVNLLIGLFDYNEGSIRIDGTELRDINKKWLRKNIGIVLQEPFLFSRTLRENISISRHDCDATEIDQVTRIAAIDKVINEFDQGFDTMVGEKGVTLSGGQKQRVAIARTLLNSGKILIFDDSLSAVDVETDAHIREQLKLHLKDTTTLIISHRVSTLRQADLILVMENGSISHQGTHEELIRVPGLYKEVFELQNALEEDILTHERGTAHA